MNVSCPIYVTGRGLQVSHTPWRGDSLSAALWPNTFILFSNTFPLGKVQKLYAVQMLKYLATSAPMCHTLCVTKGCTELEQTVEAAAGSPSHKYGCQVRNYQQPQTGKVICLFRKIDSPNHAHFRWLVITWREQLGTRQMVSWADPLLGVLAFNAEVEFLTLLQIGK